MIRWKSTPPVRPQKTLQRSLPQHHLIHIVCHVSRPIVLLSCATTMWVAPRSAAFCNGRASAPRWPTTGSTPWSRPAPSGPIFVLLSLLLRDLSGLEVCCRLRRRSEVPVVMLSGTDSVSEPEVGLALGADDYVVWPTRRREMVARLRAVLRRTNGHSAPAVVHEPIEVGGLSLDPGAYEARLGGQRLQLSPKEFELLELLVENTSRTIPKRILAPSAVGFRLRLRLATVGGQHHSAAVQARTGRRGGEPDRHGAAGSATRTCRTGGAAVVRQQAPHHFISD